MDTQTSKALFLLPETNKGTSFFEKFQFHTRLGGKFLSFLFSLEKRLRKLFVSPIADPAKLNHYYDILDIIFNNRNIQSILTIKLKKLATIEDSHTQLIYVMKKQVYKRPLTFLGNLLKFVNHL